MKLTDKIRMDAIARIVLNEDPWLQRGNARYSKLDRIGLLAMESDNIVLDNLDVLPELKQILDRDEVSS